MRMLSIRNIGAALFGIIILIFLLVLMTGCAYNPPVEFVASNEYLAIDIYEYVKATMPADTPENKDVRCQGIWIMAKSRQHSDYLTKLLNKSPLVDSVLELIRKGDIPKEEVERVRNDLGE